MLPIILAAFLCAVYAESGIKLTADNGNAVLHFEDPVCPLFSASLILQTKGDLIVGTMSFKDLVNRVNSLEDSVSTLRQALQGSEALNVRMLFLSLVTQSDRPG